MQAYDTRPYDIYTVDETSLVKNHSSLMLPCRPVGIFQKRITNRPTKKTGKKKIVEKKKTKDVVLLLHSVT